MRTTPHPLDRFSHGGSSAYLDKVSRRPSLQVFVSPEVQITGHTPVDDLAVHDEVIFVGVPRLRINGRHS